MNDPRPAADGTLDPETLRDLMRFDEFFAIRDKAVRALGPNMTPTKLRTEMIRLVLIEFGHGRANGLSFYQRKLESLAGRFAIRDEVHRLADFGLLVLENHPKDRRLLIVRPSHTLVEWCEKQVPILKSEILRLFLLPPVPL